MDEERRKQDEMDGQPDLWATFWLFDEPEMDTIMTQAGDSLQPFLDKLKLSVLQVDDKDRLFLARYEFPGWNESFIHQDGVLNDDAIGLIDFLSGFSYGDIEMLGVIGELSTKEGKVDVVPGDDAAAPPLPKSLFEGFEEKKIIANLMWLAEDEVDLMAETLEGTEDAKNPHFWVRWNIIDKEAKWPTPGELLALAVRLFPTSPWGEQKSNPFLFSANWMDTLFYSAARVTEVLEPTDIIPFNRYKVKWRGQEVTAKPTDFSIYAVDDRVAILKAPENSKKSHTWELDDKGNKIDVAVGPEFDKENWVIVPITFYEVE